MVGRKFEMEHDCIRFRFKVMAWVEATDKLEILENTTIRWIPAEMLRQGLHEKILREVSDHVVRARKLTTPGAPSC
jgi:hypothetical protein